MIEQNKIEPSPAKPKAKHARVAPDGALYIDSLEPSLDLSQTSSCLEFLLTSFCQSFNVSPKQAAGLLTQGNKFLAHIIVKGLKGDHSKISDWLSLLKVHSAKLNGLISAEIAKGSLSLILSALKPGLLCRYLDTASKASEIIFIVLSNPQVSYEYTLKWVSKEGLEAIVLCLRRLGDGVGSVIGKLLMRLESADLLNVVTSKMKKLIEDPIEYLKTLQVLYLGFIEEKDRFVKSELLTYYLNYCLSAVDAQAITDPKSKAGFSIKRINTLCMIWVDFAEKLDEHSNEILSEIKKAMKDASIYTKIAIIGHFFYLLDRFYLSKNPVVGLLFKLLIFTLIENYDVEALREFILYNFIQIIESMETIPIFSLLDPFLKQAEYTRSSRFNLFDFDFFVSASQHARTAVDNMVYILDILSKNYLEDLLYAKASVVPVIYIIGTHYNDKPAISQFAIKLCEVTLGIATGIETSRYQKVEKKDKKNKNLIPSRTTSSRDLALTVDQAHRRQLIYDLIGKIIKLGIENLNKQLIKLLVDSNSKIKELQKSNCKAIEYLLGLIGNAEELIREFDNHKVVLYQNSEISELTPLYKPPAITGKAAEDIERIKNLRQLKLQKQAKNEEKAKRKQKKLLEIAAKDLESMKTTNERVGILEEAEGPNSNDTNVEYFDLALEPKPEQETLEKMIKRYSVPLKLLFTRYNRPILSSSQSDLSKFDDSSISDTQILTLLKSEFIIPDLLKREDALWLLKECFKREPMTKSDSLQFSKKSFISLLIQISANLYKSSSLYQSTPLAFSFYSLLTLFRSNEKVPKIYDEFDPGNADREVVNFINGEFEEGKEVKLPEDLVKTIDYQFDLVYEVPKNLQVRKGLKRALEVLDFIMEKAVGVHLLRPQLKVQQKSVARGNLSTNSVVLPVYLAVAPMLKYNILLNTRVYPVDLLIDCAKCLEDLLSSVAQGKSPQMISTFYNKSQKNGYLRQKEVEAYEIMQKKQKSDINRIQRKQELQKYLSQKRQEIESKEKEEQKLKQEEAELENKRLMELEEKKKREKIEKKKLIEDWKHKKMEEERQRVLDLQKEKLKSASQSFLPKIKKNLAEIAMKFTKKSRDNSVKGLSSVKASDNSKSLAKILLDTKKLVEVEQKKKAEFSKYLELKEVKDAFTEYNKVLELLFQQFIKLTLKNPTDSSSGLDFKGLNKLCLDFSIQPALLSSSDLTQIFNRLTKDRAKSLSLEEFKVFLAEVSFLASESLQKSLQSPPDSISFRLLMTYMKLSPEFKSTLQIVQLLTKKS